jgi:hypothetical protein
MAFEDLQTRIALLFDEMTNQPEDEHQIAEQIREMLNEMRASGLPLPADLVELEARLEAGFNSGAGDTPPVEDLASREARGTPAESDGEDPLLDSPGAPPL